jgi:HEAT repeat protein
MNNHYDDEIDDERVDIEPIDDFDVQDDVDEDGQARLQERPDIDTTIQAVISSDGMNATLFYGLSDLDEREMAVFAPVWRSLDDERRQTLMRQLVDIGEANFEFDYSGVAQIALDDPDTQVREAAIELLWDSESTAVLHRLLEMAQWDEASDVRAAAASGVGRFILSSELGEFSESEGVKAQDIMLNILNNEDEEVEVRRRALEAVANSSNEAVEGAIRDAYDGGDHMMRVSAIFAMGRSCDEQWNDIVLRELDSDDPEMRYEAARAAGELMIAEALPALTRMAFENDRELQNNAIWSLGEIGGKEAVRVLTTLAGAARESDDDDLVEAIDDALANANLGGDLYLLQVDDEDEP